MRRHVAVLGIAALSLLGAVACGDEGAGESVSPGGGTSPSDSTGSPTTPSTTDDSDGGLQLRFGAVKQRSVDGGADGRNTTAAVAAVNQFSVDLYKSVLAREEGNVIVGPYSVTFALSMIYAGARGQTAAEIAAVLHASEIAPASWHEGINAYDLTLDARTAGSPTKWTSGNKVWTVPGLPLRDEFLDVLTGSYGSPLAELEFGADPEGARGLINDWVDRHTMDLIPALFPEGSFDASTQMVLVNAVAMDAPWEFPFDPAGTRPGTFTLADGSAIEVPLMHYDEYLPSLWTEQLQAVELPYGGGALSMIVIVPNDLAAFEASLTADSLADVINGIEDGGIHLSMPKWSARTRVPLADVLGELGMPTAFGAGADFSGMIDGGGLWIDSVQHEAFVEVDEQGTRAAAATGGEMAASHGPTVDVNKPFLYVIYDRGAKAMLFIGRVTDPTIEPA